MAEVTLYRRHHCGLCDDALFELQQLARTLSFHIVERDIDADDELRARYGDLIPVVAVGDLELAHAPIDPDALRASLESALAGGAPPLASRGNPLARP